MGLRKEVVRCIYLQLLNREPDDEGLNFYSDGNFPIETVYSMIYRSEEAANIRDAKRKEVEEEKKQREKNILPITLSMFVKNNERSIPMSIGSMKDYVKEVVVLDTGSEDNSVSLCKSLGARVYQCNFSSFGNIRTLAAHLSREKYVFMLDSDEMILKEDIEKFWPILDRMENEGIEIVGLPRKRWTDLEMNNQEEPWAWPDYQMRLFLNNTKIKYIRRIHEIISGSDKIIECENGPCIQHFPNVFKTDEELKERNNLYKKFFDLDVSEGVEHKGKAFEDLDKR